MQRRINGGFALILLITVSSCVSESGNQPREPEEPAEFFSPSVDLSIPPERLGQVGEVGSGSALTLGRVADAILHNDGFVVADAQSKRVSLHGNDGEILWMHGRGGSGPGEYRQIDGVRRWKTRGLVIWDEVASRVTFVDSSGILAGSLGIPRQPGVRIELLGAIGTQFLAFEHRSQLNRDALSVTPRLLRADVALVFRDQETGAVAMRYEAPGKEVFAARSPAGAFGSEDVFGGRDTYAAVSDSTVVFADSDSLSFTRLRPPQDRVKVSFPSTVKPIPENWAESRRQEMLRKTNQDAERRRGRAIISGGQHGDGQDINALIAELRTQLLATLPTRETFPAFSSIVGGEAFSFWVRGYPEPSDDSVPWVLVNDRWQPQSYFRISTDRSILDIRGNRILTLATGEFEEDIVSVWSIREK